MPAYYNVYWKTTSLAYFTDPGALSTHVSHAQADAMVAAAAAVWNVPTSSISFRQGGELAEHVSTGNTFFDGTQVDFPADVQTGNEGNIPVAVIYDTDGGVTDLLLGEGASDPDSCRQNAVVGDVDDIHQWDGAIAHATLILNGRCVGSAPEQLTQMQYQLARAFGRVLGLAWSQVNDNVFTGQTTITANQMAYWPLMHPIDVICGNYSYQCMSNPFTLRVDDLNSLADLYAVPGGATPPGKQASDDGALFFRGYLYFPTGQGMDWVNITTTRQNNGYTPRRTQDGRFLGRMATFPSGGFRWTVCPTCSSPRRRSIRCTPGTMPSDRIFVRRRRPRGHRRRWWIGRRARLETGRSPRTSWPATRLRVAVLVRTGPRVHRRHLTQADGRTGCSADGDTVRGGVCPWRQGIPGPWR